jgi:tRNA A-37 threonylcarbamoyl transferase component Bud32
MVLADVSQNAAETLVDARYELLGELGHGECSRVYEALDRESGERVALKLLTPPALSRKLVTTRLLGELRRVSGFEHPGAVRVLRAFEWREQVAIVMPRIAGISLAARVAARGPLDSERAVALARDLARALASAHARGILHRDVKPSNVWLGEDGRDRLCDFGCARLEGQVLLGDVDRPVANVAFLPPEVVAGRSADSRSDLYALGMTLYFALTGRVPPSPNPGLPPAPRAEGHAPAVLSPDTPAWLDAVVARLTRAAPADRFATARDLLAAVEQRTSDRGSAADPRLLDVCVVCRQPGTLGLPVCPHCEDTSGEPDDVLVVLEAGVAGAERDERERRLAGLTDQHADSPLLGWTAAGRLPLVRVSERQARRIAQRLAAHGLPAQRVRVDTAWRLLPRALEWAPAGIAGVAIACGAAGHPLWLCALLLLAGVLPMAATALLQHVALLPRRMPPRPPVALVQEVSGVMPALETGEARHLLVDCLRLGRALDERVARAAAGGELRRVLVGALLGACAAARELASLEPLLAALRLHGPHRFELPEGLLECRTLVERARAGLVQALLETTAALSQLRRLDVLDPICSAAELEKRSAELADACGAAADLAKDGLARFAAGH